MSQIMRLVLLALVVTPLLAASGAARESSASGEPTVVYVSPSDLTTKIVGATPKQEEILREALSGVGDERIDTITVEEPEPGWGSAPDDVGLRISPRPEAARDMRAGWEAWLIANALAVRSHELGLPSIAYMAEPGEASAIGEAAYEMARRGTKEKVDAFVRRIEAESKRAGAQVQEIQVLKPLDYALAITLRVSDPAEFLDHRAPKLFVRLGEPPGDFDLRFVDSDGNRISENWHALSGGSVWIRPDLDGCSPYLVSRPTTYKPPPCPTASPLRQQAGEARGADRRVGVEEGLDRDDLSVFERPDLAGRGRDAVLVLALREHGAEDENAIPGFVELERVEAKLLPAVTDRLEDLSDPLRSVMHLAVGRRRGSQDEVRRRHGLQLVDVTGIDRLVRPPNDRDIALSQDWNQAYRPGHLASSVAQQAVAHAPDVLDVGRMPRATEAAA
jgi:hypothetical protein